MRQLFLIAITWGVIPIYFIDPFYGVIHYTMFNIIRPDQLVPWANVGRIFYAFQVACFASWLVNREKLTPEYTSTPLQVKILWLLALEMTIVTFTVAFDSDRSWGWTLNFIKMTVFCFVMSKSINTAKKLERYYAVSVLWFTLLAIWGIQQKFLGNVNMEDLNSQIPDRNAMAAVIVLYLPMAYYFIFSRKKWIRLFIGIPSFIILVIFILFGGSRGGFLGLMACLAIIFLKSQGIQKIKIMVTFVILGGILAGLLSTFAPEGFFDEYKARLSTILGEENKETGETEYEGSAAGRVAMWKAAWYIYRTHPEYWLLGVGMNNFASMYMRHFDEFANVLNADEFAAAYRGGIGGREIHNTYLSILLGGGAVVFLTWMFLVVYVWLQVHNIPRRYPRIVDGVDIHNYARAIETGIIGYCVCITFVNMEFIDFFYWYLTMSGIIANLGKAKLQREALGLEDEEFLEQPARSPAYSSYV
jgi:O-antigen ligase